MKEIHCILGISIRMEKNLIKIKLPIQVNSEAIHLI